MSGIRDADHSELIVFADHLVETGAFSGPGDVVSFFEKPWKWSDEFDAWKRTEATWETEEMGRWIANDEVLYHSCRGGSADLIQGVVMQWIKENRGGDFDVDLSLVDWGQVSTDAQVSA